MTEEDIKFIEKAIEIRNKGMFVNSTELTEVYNRVLNKNLRPSNCSSCIRQRINELEAALKAFKAQNKAMETPPEALKDANPTIIPSDENKPQKGRKKKS